MNINSIIFTLEGKLTFINIDQDYLKKATYMAAKCFEGVFGETFSCLYCKVKPVRMRLLRLSNYYLISMKIYGYMISYVESWQSSFYRGVLKGRYHAGDNFTCHIWKIWWMKKRKCCSRHGTLVNIPQSPQATLPLIY